MTMTYDLSQLVPIVFAMMLFIIVVAWYFGFIGNDKEK